MPSERWNQLQRARSLVELGRCAEARDVLTPFVAAEPDDADALRLLARAHLGLDDGIRALQAAHASLMVEPNDAQGHVLASGAYADLGRTVEAIESAQRSVDADPEAWWTWTTFARALARDPLQRTDAWLAAMAAVKRGPREPTVHRTIGDVASDLGWTEKARVAYEVALSLDPTDGAALNNLARLQMTQRDSAAAATGFMSAMAADPHEEAPAINLLGMAHGLVRRALTIALLSAFIVGWTFQAEVPLDLGAWPGPFRLFLGLGIAATMIGLSVTGWRAVPEDVQQAWRAAAAVDPVLRRGVRAAAVATGCVVIAAIAPVLPALICLGLAAVVSGAALLAGLVARPPLD